jgi:hypothetical protein
MPTIDEDIARKLQEAVNAGELRLAESYGTPLADMEGWDETPLEFRMPFKILKDAGYAPPEIAMFHRRAELRSRLGATVDADEAAQLRQQLMELEQRLALRLEALRVNGSL